MSSTVTQVSILNALFARRFDGHFPCRDLLDLGDLGIGTFDRMDGELIMVDGVIYQGRGDGRIYAPDPENRTPFATVCPFTPSQSWPLEGPMDYAALGRSIDEKAPNHNVFYAIRVEGTFSGIRLQALQKQSKPYPPTADVVKGCARTELANVSGTIVGFRGVPYVEGINDTGYHLHFVTDDRTRGGHVLEFELLGGSCSIGACNKHLVILPDDGAALAGIDMRRNLAAEFHAELSQET